MKVTWIMKQLIPPYFFQLVRKGVELYGPNWVKFKTLLPKRTDAQVRERLVSLSL
jgi:hypothetical protein